MSQTVLYACLYLRNVVPLLARQSVSQLGRIQDFVSDHTA